MSRLKRAEREAAYLIRRAEETRLKIRLGVTSAGVRFEIVAPSTGQILLRSPRVAPRSTRDFQLALDRAIASANELNFL